MDVVYLFPELVYLPIIGFKIFNFLPFLMPSVCYTHY